MAAISWLWLTAAVGDTALAHSPKPGQHETLAELNRFVVRQTTKFTCGPAALSTLLRYRFGLEFEEHEIATAMLNGRSMTSIEARGGFSLLDLFVFAEALGYDMKAERDLSLDGLITRLPAIVPVTATGEALHFLVVLEHRGDQFAVADPATGGRLIGAAELNKVWPGIALSLQTP